jgi:hypothetical protein
MQAARTCAYRGVASVQEGVAMPGVRSPGQVAVSSFGGGRFASVIREVISPPWAVVLLATNEEPDLYPYQVICHHDGREWEELGGGNGPGWSHTEGDLGVLTFWDDAPEGASSVTVSYRGTIDTSPVRYGYFLAVFWNVPDHEVGYGSPPVIADIE